MDVIKTAIPGVVIVEPKVFGDARGYFLESWNQRDFDAAVGPIRFVQDNESKSRYGVLRGLHFQTGDCSQSKLVRVVSGRVLDVAVDIRKGSPIKDGDSVVGNQVKVKVVKNKVAPPFRKAEFEIMFGEGISRVGEIVDLGVEYGILKKSGSWFSYEDSRIGQGRDAVKAILRDNPELCDEIAEKIFKAMANMPATEVEAKEEEREEAE